MSLAMLRSQLIPDVEAVLRDHPKLVGLVYQSPRSGFAGALDRFVDATHVATQNTTGVRSNLAYASRSA